MPQFCRTRKLIATNLAREIEIFSNLLASLNIEASSVDEKHKNLDSINQAIEQYLEAYHITELQGFSQT